MLLNFKRFSSQIIYSKIEMVVQTVLNKHLRNKYVKLFVVVFTHRKWNMFMHTPESFVTIVLGNVS